MLLNNFLLHRDSSYAISSPCRSLTSSPCGGVCRFLSYVFANPLSQYFRYFLWAATLLLALLAVSKRVRAGLGVTELYLLAILAVISAYWAPSPRYLLCVIPIYMVYMFEGFRTLVARVPQRFVRPLQVAAAALMLLAPAANAILVRPDANDTL